MDGNAEPHGPLTLENVTVSLKDRPLFAPIDLSVSHGQAVTVMGPSGSGKSTLLAAICGTLDPVFRQHGRIKLNGRALDGLPPEERRVGILFQDDLLFPHLSVADNLAFGLPPALSKAERMTRIEAALQEADMPGFGTRDPTTLSGGQRARITLMRTLLAQPGALLLDEPFAKLDADLRLRIRRFVFDHATSRALPVLLVTHDPADAEAARGPILSLK